MANNDIYTVRQLTEKFFNATLSDQESERLSGYAEDLTGPNPSFEVNDMQLLNDLELIKSLNSHSEAYLKALALQTPPELEQILDNQISKLARSSRRRLIFKRLIPMTAAAAVVAVVATVGFKATEGINMENPQKLQYASTPDNAEAGKQSSPQLTGSSESPSFIEINKPVEHVAAKVSNSPALHQALSVQTAQALSAVAIATEPEKINLPYFSDPVIDVMPMIAAASIDPSNIVIQPLSTLSQTVCNVYESVDAVSSSFAGIAETLDLVNSSLSLLAATGSEMQ